jgi:alanine racemase
MAKPKAQHPVPRFAPWIEIDLDALAHNLREIRRKAGNDRPVLAVVKDRAYGLGAGAIARELADNGVSFFAVAREPEARSLRESGVSSPILILGECDADAIRWGSAQSIRFTLNDIRDLNRWAECACPIVCHCLVDTGMGRMGILPDEVPAAIEVLRSNRRITLEGVFTHLSSADVPRTLTVKKQIRAFNEALTAFRSAGLDPQHIHCSNSAGILRFADLPCTLIRPGIGLYGCLPDPSQNFGIDLRTVASLKAPIAKVKKVPARTPISYGGNYVTSRETKIATAPIGYAHGLPRLLGNKGEVLIRGRRYRIAGNVTMDYVMLDVGSDSPIIPGDEVVALGCQGNDCISADEIARHACTIGYEVLCNLSTAVDRYYVHSGKPVVHQPGFLF